jgi:hypothetical protein
MFAPVAIVDQQVMVTSERAICVAFPKMSPRRSPQQILKRVVALELVTSRNLTARQIS